MSRAFRVLFLCSGNSCRSQMAEGLLREMQKDKVECFSAGASPEPVHELAVEAMNEVGIDISRQTSKSLVTFSDQRFDYVITLCDKVREDCADWPGMRDAIHWNVEDPTKREGPAAERLIAFRQARNTIRQRLQLFVLSNKL
jgi:arsenate reductase (thioredoxin)